MRAFIPPALALTIPARHFRSLFESWGATLPFFDDAPPVEVARCLYGIEVSNELYEVIDDIPLLATPEGLLGIEEAVRDLLITPPREAVGAALATWALTKGDETKG